jgi:DnaJ-class molecular chaperone
MDAKFLMDTEKLARGLDQLDYFQILQLPQNARPADIKNAYYAHSRAYHPDRFNALPAGELKDMVGKIYRRVNEAYLILRDDVRRQKYVADINGPERVKRLRFTEEDEVKVKEDQKKKMEDQLGTTPQGRKCFAAALADIQAQRWDAAQRNLKSALMFEPANAKFKEQLAAVDAAIKAAKTAKPG